MVENEGRFSCAVDFHQDMSLIAASREKVHHFDGYRNDSYFCFYWDCLVRRQVLRFDLVSLEYWGF